MMTHALVVGGANGIGLTIALELTSFEEVEKVYVVDKVIMSDEYQNPKIESFQFDLTSEDYSFFDRFSDVDALMITAGFGKLALFRDVDEAYIINTFIVNTISVIRLIKHFYDRIDSPKDFHCGVMVSIAGWLSSPFFSVYAASKAALKIFIESVNVELLKSGVTNQIMNVSPGFIKGTSFYNGKTDVKALMPLARSIITGLEEKRDLFIPQYEEVFKNVLERYHEDFRKEGLHSYDYKVQSGRVPK